MKRLTVLGATGNLGRRVAAQALAQGHSLSVGVRSRHKLAADIAARAKVSEMDLDTTSHDSLARFIDGNDALICCAGLVTDGDRFVALIDKVVSAIESLPAARRPVSWFLAGAAVLPLDERGRRGVDLPKVRTTYWPHARNLERLQRSTLDWRLLCPGPMVDQPALGPHRLRIAIEALASPLPSMAKHLAAPLLLPLFAAKVPEMIVPYDDSATLMLSHLSPGGEMSRCRVGLALPAGMRGRKDRWTARA
jgi:uncharacterized protein